ncbi:MAG: hypothetical protein NC110_03120 [Ruminococcus sp.]|nr:hypothetical protein [Ruminococcus sp.]
MRKFVNGNYIDMTKCEEEQARKMQTHEQVMQLKQQLLQSDYKAIKFAEGLLSADEFESTKAERQKIREKINELMKGAN